MKILIFLFIPFLFSGLGLKSPLYASETKPNNIDSLKSWWCADYGITKDGSDDISAWLDKTGNYNATTSNKPHWHDKQINGYPAIGFSGNGEYLTANNLSSLFTGSDKPFTMIIVMAHNDGIGNEVVLGFGGDGPSPRHHIDINSNNYRLLRRDDSNVLKSISGGSTNTSWIIRSHIFSGTTITEYINGETIINNQDLDVGIATFTKFAIGCIHYATTYTAYFYGFISEIVIYNRVITDFERLEIETYLALKYNIEIERYIRDNPIFYEWDKFPEWK